MVADDFGAAVSERRYPLVVGEWAKEMDGRICQLIEAMPIPGGYIYRVRYEDGETAMRLPGFLESVPSEFAP